MFLTRLRGAKDNIFYLLGGMSKEGSVDRSIGR